MEKFEGIGNCFFRGEVDYECEYMSNKSVL